MSYSADLYAQGFVGHPTDPNVGLPPGWIARWDQGSQHWFYVDTSSGRTQWERPSTYQAPPPPQQGYYSGGGGGKPSDYDHHFDEKGYHKNWESQQGKYAAEDHHKTPSTPPKAPKKHHNWGGYAAAGAGALGLGLLGGAVLDHEGEKVAGWAGDEVGKAEGKWDNLEYDVANAPENAANWAGQKVGDVGGKWDNLESDVVNAPENAANWVGGKVGEVEQFGDNVDNAYDEGRNEGRYGDDDGSSSSSSDDNGGGDYDDDGGDYEE